MKLFRACSALFAVAALSASAAQFGLHPDLTWASKYMAHGFNINGDNPSFQPSLHVDTLVPGLQFAVWAGLPTDRDDRAKDEFDYMLKYGRTCNADSPWAVNVHGYVDYWLYPNTANAGEIDPATGEVIDELTGWKFNGGVALPKLLPLGPANLVPGYNYYYWTPRDEDVFQSGGVHELLLSYALPADAVLPVASKQTIDLGSSLNYHDGVFDVKEGWSHATASLSTTFNLSGTRITPGVNYQWSFEDTVNDEDEFWAQVSVARDF